MVHTIRIIAVTVNWNRYQDTLECIKSLEEQTCPLEKILVVDNGSQNNEADIFDSIGKPVSCIRSAVNLGFAGGYNLGIRYALESNPDYVLILNNDTIADPDMVKELIKFAIPISVPVIAPMIYYYDQPEKVWSAGGDLTPGLLAPSNPHNRRGCHTQAVFRTFLSGCCLLIKPEIVSPNGLFDDRFFLYFEDLDLSVRLKNAGLKMMMVPSAKLWHKVSASSGGFRSPTERYWMARSNIVFSRKYTTTLNAFLIWPHRLISTILWTARLFFSGQWDALKEYWKGTIDGFKV